MNTMIDIADIRDYASGSLDQFHKRQAESLEKVFASRDVLLRRIARNLEDLPTLTLSEAVRLETARCLQKSADFTEDLKGLALHICKSFAGRKSSADGIDLEFERDGTYYIVAIKSGPNWGNSRQISKMRDDFNKAKRILRTNAARRNIEAINGCCYGKVAREDKGDYLLLCGQSFWSFISGIESLYLDIIEPIGREARAPNEEVELLYAGLVNKLTGEVVSQFCDANGLIDWPALVRFNSGRAVPR
jgi:hypothetical protein